MTRWVGQPLPRREDLPLLTGRGTFVDDVQVPNPLHVAFARSPFAHADIALTAAIMIDDSSNARCARQGWGNDWCAVF